MSQSEDYFTLTLCKRHGGEAYSVNCYDCNAEASEDNYDRDDDNEEEQDED